MSPQTKNKKVRATQKKRVEMSRLRPMSNSVLRLIWDERRISRAQVAQRTGLSRSTVSEILVGLLKTGLVAEVGTGPSRGGRPPIVLEFQDEAHCILGIDIGATHVSVALTDMRGRVHVWREVEHPVRTDPEGTRALVFDLCDACLSTWGRKHQSLLRIGVALPSPIDPIHPEWLSEVVIPAWGGHSGLELLRQRYGVPVNIDNDANLAALAEHWWGAGRGVDDLVFIKMGLGIGGGYIFRGKIYRGAEGVAGEIGHLPLDPNGQQCICGMKGCLATFVGAAALVARTKQLLTEHAGSSLAHENLTITAIEDAALAGDALALQVVREAATHMGTAVAALRNLVDPRMIIIGGGLSRVGDLLVGPLREVVRRSTLVTSVPPTEIRTSKLGPQAVAIGAATLALEVSFVEPLFPRKGPHPGEL